MKNLKIKAKISLLIVSVCVVLSVASIAALIIGGNNLNNSVGQKLIESGVSENDKLATSIYNLLDAGNQASMRSVRDGLKVAETISDQYGRIMLDDRVKVKWPAVNQYTKKASEVELPAFMVGTTKVEFNNDISTPTPVVDTVKDLTGITATIFQRMNEEGDMLRIATNVEKLDGKRAVGTFIPAVNPDGKKNPVISTVMSGETYFGKAYVVNAWYNTAYKPIKDSSGEVVGILYVGEKQVSVPGIREAIMNTVVGKTGYVFILGGNGNTKGDYIISKGGARDGENILGAKDANGKEFIKDIVEAAVELGENADGTPEIHHTEYYWKNSGETSARKKVVSVAYYEPWNWVIGAGTYEDDFTEALESVNNEIGLMEYQVIGITIFVLVVGVIITFILSGKMVAPLISAMRVLKKYEQGNLNERLEVVSGDEIGEMAKSLNNFADVLEHEMIAALSSLAKGDLTFRVADHDSSDVVRSSLVEVKNGLLSLINEIKVSAEQIAEGASQVAAGSEELSQGATVNASSVEEITSTITELSAQIKSSADHAQKAASLSTASRDDASAGVEQMTELMVAMNEINQAGQDISNIIKVIEDIASQTNLLSLNAAVEAARAGQHGKGFAVVAEEVRSLAQRCAKAANETAELIEGSAQKAQKGVDIAQRTEQALEKIVDGVTEATGLVTDISQSSAEQATGINEVTQGLGQIDETTQSTTATAEESAAAAEELNSQAEALNDLLKQFKTS